MPRITGVVKYLLLINIGLFLLANYAMPQLYELFIMRYPASPQFMPLQLVTHMFMHAGFNHLLFNMFALYMFGSALEMYWGHKRFLKYYLICGFGAMALHLLVWYFELSAMSPLAYEQYINGPHGMLGASGAVFGLLAGYGLEFPNSRIMLLIPPIPMKAKYFVLIYAGIEFFFGVSNLNTGVAHFAHLGGALCGLLLILMWRKTGKL